MNCLNCNSKLNTNDSYCSGCGAKVVIDRPTFKGFVSEFGERVFTLDNSLFRTIATLISHPSKVVNGYLDGLRKRYVDPIRFLLLAVTFSGVNAFLVKRGFFGEIDINRYIENVEQDDAQAEMFVNLMNFLIDYNNVIMFLTIPILALISKIVFYDLKKYSLFEHNVIYSYTYSLCAIFATIAYVLFTVLGFDYFALTWIFSLLYIVYHIFALKNIFGLSLKQTLLKTLLFLVVGIFFYLALAIFIGVLYSLLS